MSHDEVCEIVFSLIEEEIGEKVGPNALSKMMPKKVDWSDAAYVLISYWSQGGFFFEPLDSELTGLVDRMQASLDAAGDEYGYYGMYVLDLNGTRSEVKITGAKLV